MQDRFEQPCLCTAGCDASSGTGSFSLALAAGDAARSVSVWLGQIVQPFADARAARDDERLRRSRLG